MIRWGYNGADYAQQSGAQIQFIRNIIATFTKTAP